MAEPSGALVALAASPSAPSFPLALPGRPLLALVDSVAVWPAIVARV